MPLNIIGFGTGIAHIIGSHTLTYYWLCHYAHYILGSSCCTLVVPQLFLFVAPLPTPLVVPLNINGRVAACITVLQMQTLLVAPLHALVGATATAHILVVLLHTLLVASVT